jgi:transposase-like protein
MISKNIINFICPYCESKYVIRYGRYKNKQIYLCKNCGKKYSDFKLKNKTYEPQVMIEAISFYNLGNTIDETVKYINKKFKIKVSSNSIQYWIMQYSKICSFRKIRSNVLRYLNKKEEIIKSYSFKHSGLTYNFMYHRPKLEMYCKIFPNLLRFITKMKDECPSDFFNEDNRCSQIKLNIKARKEGRFNQACKLAAFCLKTCSSNSKRHNILEKFMLVNDKSTIACEVPVWFWEKYMDIGICGHIDILQIRRGNIYILDYKPDAEKENDSKVSSLLFLYASGLSFRTKIPLMRFRCAWFDEKNYYEFNPSEQNFSFKFKNNLYFKKL